MPQRDKPSKDQWLSRGPGVAFADELTVCGAIAQEFLRSRLPYGHRAGVEPTWKVKVDEDYRHYTIQREWPYTAEPHSERCDLRVVRMDPRTRMPLLKKIPTMIEAKRLYR